MRMLSHIRTFPISFSIFALQASNYLVWNLAIQCRRSKNFLQNANPHCAVEAKQFPFDRCPLWVKSGHAGRSCGICLPPGFYARAMAIFEVMLALTFPSLRSGARCAPMAAFNIRCVPRGNVARDGASGVAASALVA
jgi:hypothetical protein